MMPLLLLLAFQQQPKPKPLSAPVRVAGVVLRSNGPDSVPTGRVTVVLHRVGQKVQGPIDSVTSDASGRFRLQFHPDSAALYLVSARFRGIEYFAPPVSRDALHPDLDVRVVVYDTSSTISLVVAARHIVVSAPDPAGIRNVADLIVLDNSSAVTRLAGDSTHPIWTMLLPRGVDAVEMGETDFAAEATTLHGDTLVLNASIPPGQRAFTLAYRIPAGISRFEIPVDRNAVAADVLTEEPSLKVAGGLVRGDTVTVVERRFTKWAGTLSAGKPVVLEFTDARPMPNWVLPGLIGVLGVGLLVISVAANRRATRAVAVAAVPPAAAVPAPSRAAGLSAEAGALLDRIATLDAAHAGGRGAVSADEWQEYLRERAALKSELTALLPR